MKREEEEEKLKLLKGSSLGRAFTGCPGSVVTRPGPWVLWPVLWCTLPT